MSYSTTLALGATLGEMAAGLAMLTSIFFILITIIVVLVDKGTPLHKIIWMVLALLLPVLSLILYFKMGARTRNL